MSIVKIKKGNPEVLRLEVCNPNELKNLYKIIQIIR